MSIPVNPDLRYALENSLKTTAPVTTVSDAIACVSQAEEFWIERHLRREWQIITIELTLQTTLIEAISPSLITKKDLGILHNYKLQGFCRENLLIIYTSDQFTESWVHSLVLATSHPPTNRILNVVRNDPDELIDLGAFKFGNVN